MECSKGRRCTIWRRRLETLDPALGLHAWGQRAVQHRRWARAPRKARLSHVPQPRPPHGAADGCLVLLQEFQRCRAAARKRREEDICLKGTARARREEYQAHTELITSLKELTEQLMQVFPPGPQGLLEKWGHAARADVVLDHRAL